MTVIAIIAIIVAAFLHLTVGGFVRQQIINSCPQHSNEGSKYNYCDVECGRWWLAFFSVISWPVIVPVALGTRAPKLGAVMSNRGERRRDREIAEANHKVALAQIRARETEALEKALH